MVHLRIVVPSYQAEHTLDLLKHSPSVVNLIYLERAAQRPEGDVILCDVAREDASVIISDLRELDIDREGSIAMETIDSQISDAALAAEKASAGLPSDAVVWEEVEARTSENVELSASFLAFMALAMLIAMVGILTDQLDPDHRRMIVGRVRPSGLCVLVRRLSGCRSSVSDHGTLPGVDARRALRPGASPRAQRALRTPAIASRRSEHLGAFGARIAPSALMALVWVPRCGCYVELRAALAPGARRPPHALDAAPRARSAGRCSDARPAPSGGRRRRSRACYEVASSRSKYSPAGGRNLAVNPLSHTRITLRKTGSCAHPSR